MQGGKSRGRRRKGRKKGEDVWGRKEMQGRKAREGNPGEERQGKEEGRKSREGRREVQGWKSRGGGKGKRKGWKIPPSNFPAENPPGVKSKDSSGCAGLISPQGDFSGSDPGTVQRRRRIPLPASELWHFSFCSQSSPAQKFLQF